MRHEIVEARHNVRWLTPVWIRIGYGLPEAIRTPRQALEHLSYRWPAERGMHYHAAKRSCTAALGDHLPCEQAREAFLRASLEAQMLD